MKGKYRTVVDLDAHETNTLLNAQKIWQDIERTFDNMRCDISSITEALDDGLEKLLIACEDGILEEVE